MYCALYRFYLSAVGAFQAFPSVSADLSGASANLRGISSCMQNLVELKILRGLVEFSDMQAVTSLQQLHPDDSLVRQAGTQAAAKRLSAEITLSLNGCKEISARERWKIRAVQPVS